MSFESKKYHLSEILNASNDRPAVGLIVLNTDFTFERDFVRMYSEQQPNYDFYFNRIHFANPMTPESLAAIGNDLTEVSAGILPGYDLDLVVFNCTSSSSIVGDDAIERAIQESKPTAKVLSTSKAVVANFKGRGFKKVSVLTPYSEEVSSLFRDYLQKNGIEIVSSMYMDMSDDREVAMLPADEIINAAKAAIHDDADAIFISCTAMRSAEIIPQIEEAIGKPVLTSNQATFDQISRMIEGLNT
jgi:maleate isomerase